MPVSCQKLFVSCFVLRQFYSCLHTHFSLFVPLLLPGLLVFWFQRFSFVFILPCHYHRPVHFFDNCLFLFAHLFVSCIVMLYALCLFISTSVAIHTLLCSALLRSALLWPSLILLHCFYLLTCQASHAIHHAFNLLPSFQFNSIPFNFFFQTPNPIRLCHQLICRPLSFCYFLSACSYVC